MLHANANATADDVKEEEKSGETDSNVCHVCLETPEGVSPQDVLLSISSVSGKVIQKETIGLDQYAGKKNSLKVPNEPFVLAAADGPLGFRCGTGWRDQHAVRLHLHRQRCTRGPLCPFWGCSASSSSRKELLARERNAPKPLLRAYCAYYRKATHAAAVCLGREFEFIAKNNRTRNCRKLLFARCS